MGWLRMFGGVSLAAVAVAVVVVLSPVPADVLPPPLAEDEVQAVGLAAAPAVVPDGIPPAPEGCFVAIHCPDPPGTQTLPWAGWLYTGSDLELHGQRYRVAGPAPYDEPQSTEWAYLEGDRPDGTPSPFRIAPN